HLVRWPLGTKYTVIVSEVQKLTAQAPLKGGTLAIDATGVGRAVYDLFTDARLEVGLEGVLITAGFNVSKDEDGFLHIAKVQLVSVVQSLLQQRRLKIAKALKLASTLESELSTFKVKITPNANEAFLADTREGAHDDMVLAVAMAAWV